MVKGLQLLKIKDILKGFQGHLMGYLGKSLQCLSPHPLGGRIRCDRLRVGRLQLLQSPQLMVVVIVGYGGLVQYIVLITRLSQLPAERLNFTKIIQNNTLLWAGIEIF